MNEEVVEDVDDDDNDNIDYSEMTFFNPSQTDFTPTSHTLANDDMEKTDVCAE
jgi:hypothetical protein